MTKDFDILDAHTHFFSYAWFDHFYQLAKDKLADIAELTNQLHWDLPEKDPSVLARHWLQEQDYHGLAGQVLFASKLNDAESVAAACNVKRDRLFGYFMFDPKIPEARNQLLYAFNVLDMRGVLLFPAMHHFHANEEMLHIVFEEAYAASAVVFIHFGTLSIPIFQRLGLPDNIDLQYSSPLDLEGPASDFRDLNFIIPHFGCGRFQEALDVASRRRNIYFDTSSSNSWITPPLTLKDVFKKSLEVLGPKRLLFGTDSSHFPRGWRRDIFELQLGILNQLGVSQKDQELIFGGNLRRILNLG